MSREKKSGMFELNIVPIIDCLTILVTFMLASGVFVSIGLLDVGVSASGAALASVDGDPPIDIQVELRPDKTFTLKVNGKEHREVSIPSVEALNAELKSVQVRWASVKAVTLIPNKQLPFQVVVKGMETIRKTHPEVMLGGF